MTDTTGTHYVSGSMEDLLTSRQEIIFIVITAICVFLAALGIYALSISPALQYELGVFGSPSVENIKRIESLELQPTFKLNLPEFFWPADEEHWWELQTTIYNVLQQKRSVTILLHNENQPIIAHPYPLSVATAFKKTWLLYLVSFLYLLSAYTVFKRHSSLPGLLLSFFFVACALYFVSSAPVINRPVTLNPVYFKLFIWIVYASSCALILLAHYALVFPRPSPLLTTFRWLPRVFYGVGLLALITYTTGLTAFGTTFPLFSISIILITGAFFHSIIRERDPFLRLQVRLNLLAPILGSLFFLFLYLLPGVLRFTPIPFLYFALISLILPFALPLVMDSYSLFEKWQYSQDERDRLRDERDHLQQHIEQKIHDSIMTNLSSIQVCAQNTLQSLDNASSDVKAELERILRTADETLDETRGSLVILKPRYGNWDDLFAFFRNVGGRIAKTGNFHFNLLVIPAIKTLPPLPAHLRYFLFLVFREAVTNIAKHARARTVTASFSCREHMLLCCIEDDGIGLGKEPQVQDLDQYGILNMQKRVEAQGGHFSIRSGCSGGTEVRFELPAYSKPSRFLATFGDEG